MKHGNTTVGIIIVDICVMGREFIEKVKALIHLRTGIDPAHLLISSTHTHAAGSIECILLGEADLAYRSQLTSLIVDAVVGAADRIRPAKIAFGYADVPEHVVCQKVLYERRVCRTESSYI